METHWIVGGLIVVFKGLIVIFTVGMGYVFSLVIFCWGVVPSVTVWWGLWEDVGRNGLLFRKPWKDLTWGNIFKDIFMIFFMLFFLIVIPLFVLCGLYGLGAMLVGPINNFLAGSLDVRSLASIGILICFCLFLINILFVDWPMRMRRD